MQTISVEELKNETGIDFQKLQKSVAELQTSLAVVNGEKENLQKHNTNLQNIANDRALALTDMKEERNLWHSRYENLQAQHNHFLEKSFRKYYHLFGFAVLLALLLLIQTLPTIIPFFEIFR